MAASGADKTATELSTDDAAATQPPYSGPSIRIPAVSAKPRAQRVRTVRLTTQVHPDVLVPFLYGERGGRGIGAIMSTTGATVDYCALSPDEAERSPRSRGFVMNFLVSAGSSETLEDATRQLMTLVDRLQRHLQKKTRGRAPRDERVMRTRSPRVQADAEAKREAIPDERWGNAAGVDVQEEEWEIPPVQRVYYAPGGLRVRRERPRYMDESDDKRDFVARRGPGEAEYTQRAQSPVHFVARRRVRRYAEQPRWTTRSYPAEADYAMFSPQAGEQAQRVAQPRQPRRVFSGAPPSRFAQADYGVYEFEDDGDEHGGEFRDYDEAADLTNENAGANEVAEFAEQHRPVQQTQPRRSLKRPRTSMRSDGPPPPPIYRQRMPYIYDYAYDDGDEEWMADDEEMAVAYGYPAQYRHPKVPIVRPRRRFDSVGSHHWDSPAGHGPQGLYKRPRVPRDGLPLDYDMSDDSVLEEPIRVAPPASTPTRTVLVDQLDEVADNVSTDASPGPAPDTTEIPTEKGSTAASPSETHNDDALQEESKELSPTNESTAVASPGEVLLESAGCTTTNNPSIEVRQEQENASPNEEPVHSATDSTSAAGVQPDVSVERTAQSEVVPLDSHASTPEIPNPEVPQRTSAPTNSPTRKTPESRVASPPPSASLVVSEENMMDATAEKSACIQALPTVAEDQIERSVPTGNEHQSSNSSETQLPLPSVEADALCESVVTDAIRINNRVIASLETMNKVEAAFVAVKTSLTEQESKFHRLESSSKCRQQLEVLCRTIYGLQCRIGSEACGLDQSRKQNLLDKLDSYLESLLTETAQTLEEKLKWLQTELEHVVAMPGLVNVHHVVPSKRAPSKTNDCESSKFRTPPPPSDNTQDKVDESDGMDYEEDGWFEEAPSADPASDSEEQENFVAQISPKEGNMKLEGDFLAVKLEEGASPRWPRELPPFVWSLLARVISSDPQTYVMRVTHKRLLDEIAKGDPYYYLHPTIMSRDAEVSSPLRSSPSQGCEFGCRGASALKWERKLVSQISSRMKSFDNVAYSLARSSGGKEVLNRKKMNSIIRKLHLVAMQLHSLVSHLYCVKGQATCKEVDSLPIALNNSHFERKMGVYKSRLKLVVPHKYQQQQTQQQASSSNEPAEELLRDTYEFFPELLLCVDIWGYNYREGQAKRRSSKGLLHDGVGSQGALFPLGFFRGVESLAFDFEHDSNGLLRCICDELLNIVCLWNDFKWTDNLAAVALERVVSFEADVTASILKILELYSHHLQALWAARLLDEPEQLRSVHFTQFNAYYSDRSQGSLNMSTGSQPRASKKTGSGASANARAIDQLVATEMVEQNLAEEYWNRKVTALSIHNPDDDAIEVDDAEPKPSLQLSAETISSWDQETLVAYLLRWSDVYAIRSEVNALSAVTNHMLKHEVQKYRFVSRSEAEGNDASRAVVDSATRQLLSAVSRAQMLVRDALIGTEKLVLHSASSQLPDERKHQASVEEEQAMVENNEAHRSTSSSCYRQAEDGPSRETASSAQDDGAITAPNAQDKPAMSDADGDAEEESDGLAPEQPELKDLIQLVAVTKQDMQELCGHRPRSARMREKVQTQSLQLARQSVEIFRNIRNMYGSQRR